MPVQAPQRAGGLKSPARTIHWEGQGRGRRQQAGSEPPKAEDPRPDKPLGQTQGHAEEYSLVSKKRGQDSGTPVRAASFAKTCARERGWRELHLFSVAP